MKAGVEEVDVAADVVEVDVDVAEVDVAEVDVVEVEVDVAANVADALEAMIILFLLLQKELMNK